MKKGLTRLAIALLVVLHLAVAHAILTPHVSAHYRGYYITHDDFMSPWEHEHLATLAPGAYSPKEAKLMLDSWDMRDDGECWNWGRTPALALRIGAGAAAGARHALVLRVGSKGAQRVMWTLNGKPVRSEVLDGDATVRFDGLDAGEVSLRIDLPDAKKIAPGDPRMWALRLDAVTLE